MLMTNHGSRKENNTATFSRKNLARGAGVVQSVSARASKLEVASSIPVSFDGRLSCLSLIRLAVALITRKTENWRRKWVRGAHRRLQVY